MRRLKLNPYARSKPLVATIGAFDGLHLGHKALINKVLKLAKLYNLNSALITFSPHPQHVLSDKPMPLLCTDGEKKELLETTDLDYLLTIPFDKAITTLSPSDFVQYLQEKMQVRYLVVGENHRFGKNRSGNFDTLQEHSSPYFSSTQCPQVKYGEEDISSTRIREALALGDMRLAQAMLGYPYSYYGVVVEGEGLGERIGFPTANLCPHPDKILPKMGVYAAKVHLAGDSRMFRGMLYIGEKNIKNDPQESEIVNEIHIFNFRDYLYDETLCVIPTAFSRAGRPMESIDDLITQLHADKEAINAY